MATWLTLSVLAFLEALVGGLMLVPLAKSQGKKLGLIDHPTLARKQHKTPVPRSGGVAIFGTFWICFWLNFFVAGLVVPNLPFLPESLRVLGGNVWLKGDQVAGLFLGASAIFALGVLDDRFSLPPGVRLLVQILACVPLVLSGIVLKLFLPPVISIPLTIFWIVLLTNSFNFLDNMNGLTSGVSIMICLVMAGISLLSSEWYMVLIFALLAGAVLAFWFHNFPKASLFLGDSGSTHLGFLLGGLSIIATYYQEGVPTKLPILIPLIVMGLPLFDTLSVMWIRWRNGKPLMQGDTNHISHRLVALGMSRTEAVLFIYAAVLALGLAAIPLRLLDWRHGILLACAIVLIFLLLHWLERVSYRWKNSSASR